jgi:hypothetical protein
MAIPVLFKAMHGVHNELPQPSHVLLLEDIEALKQSFVAHGINYMVIRFSCHRRQRVWWLVTRRQRHACRRRKQPQDNKASIAACKMFPCELLHSQVLFRD